MGGLVSGPAPSDDESKLTVTTESAADESSAMLWSVSVSSPFCVAGGGDNGNVMNRGASCLSGSGFFGPLPFLGEGIV